jgi:hypothetical protein
MMGAKTRQTNSPSGRSLLIPCRIIQPKYLAVFGRFGHSELFTVRALDVPEVEGQRKRLMTSPCLQYGRSRFGHQLR